VRRFLAAGVEEALAYADPDIVWNPAEDPRRRGTAPSVRAWLTGRPNGTSTS